MNALGKTVAREQPAGGGYRPDIDGLRALAIVVVVLFHAGVPWVNGGFVGVDIFFVISGLLIGSHVYSDIRVGKFSIAEFYAKRAKRILPALLGVLVFCYLVALPILSPRELKSLGGYGIASIFSASNILAWLKENYFAADANQNPLLMTWSLAVEEQFYVLFPILMLALRNARRKTLFFVFLLLALLSLALSIVGIARYRTATFYLLPTRAWEISAGLLMAIYQKGRRPRTLYFAQRFANAAAVLGLALIAFSIFFYDSHTAFPGLAALPPVFGAVLLLSAPGSEINQRLLSSRPFNFFGRISYSLYLWHWPLLSFAHIVSDHPLSIAMGCAIASLSVLFAWLSYRLIEQPCRASRAPNQKLLLGYGLLALVTAVPGLLYEATHGLPSRFPQLAPIEAFRSTETHRCFGGRSPILTPDCVDAQDPRPAIAVVGDSHASAITPAFRQLADKNGFKTYELTKTSCPPLVGFSRTLATSADEQECISYNAEVLSLLQRDTRVKIVAITAYWAGPEIDNVVYENPDTALHPQNTTESYANLTQGLSQTISALQGAGKQVILLRDVPVFRFDPMRRVISNEIPARRLLATLLFPHSARGGTAPLSETFSSQDTDAEAAITQVAHHTSASVFDPKLNLCANGRCAYSEAVIPLYFDKQHLSVVGATRALSGLPLR